MKDKPKAAVDRTLEPLVRQFVDGEIVRVALRSYSETSPLKMHMEQAFRAGYNQGLLVRERQIGEARAALYRIGVEVDVVMSNSVISENGRRLG
jgi:hypothetical protein